MALTGGVQAGLLKASAVGDTPMSAGLFSFEDRWV